jgi:hypothetical protein
MSCYHWHKLFEGTMRQVEFFRRRVREGVLVEDAQSFAQYIRLSCLIPLMEENHEMVVRLRELFPYSAFELERAVYALEQECYAYWRGQTRDSLGTPSGPNISDLEAIDAKLNVIGFHVLGCRCVSDTANNERRITSEGLLTVEADPDEVNLLE